MGFTAIGDGYARNADAPDANAAWAIFIPPTGRHARAIDEADLAICGTARDTGAILTGGAGITAGCATGPASGTTVPVHAGLAGDTGTGIGAGRGSGTGAPAVLAARAATALRVLPTLLPGGLTLVVGRSYPTE